MSLEPSIYLSNKEACEYFVRLRWYTRSKGIFEDCSFSFALLGPSGCGKTSLIRTLIGRLHPVENHDGRRGTILILGHRPHAFGQLVGFMPQEMALHGTNTIDEELYFYGRLANMSNQYIQQRSQFLSTLLELPPRRKFISKLSGGQQRRVSFAIALLHEPRLLILGKFGRISEIVAKTMLFCSRWTHCRCWSSIETKVGIKKERWGIDFSIDLSC